VIRAVLNTGLEYYSTKYEYIQKRMRNKQKNTATVPVKNLTLHHIWQVQIYAVGPHIIGTLYAYAGRC